MSTWKNRVGVQSPPRAGGYRPFGAFRLALAFMVLAQHATKLLTPEEKALWPGLALGPVAVACFFALSGFIVAEALARFYARRPLAFLANRCLRVVPPYLLVLALAILLESALYAAGRLAPLDEPLSGAPWQMRVILAGVFEILPGLPTRRISGQDFSFIPYAWTLRVEFAFYLAAFTACVLRRPWAVAACLGVAYAAFGRFLLLHGAGTQQILCVPFFAFGLGCFWHQRRPGLPSLLHLLAVAAFVPLAFTYWAQKGHPVLGYQLAWLCLLMACLFALARAGQVPDRLRRLDRWAGDLSYPLYIGHGLVVAALLSLAGHRGWTLYGAAILGAAIMAAWLHLVAETPLRRLRDRLRGRPV